MRVHGVTGSTDVSTVDIQQIEVGELLMGATTLPIVPDAFGGADGVLGNEALGDKRIYIDFRRDRIEIMRSRSERPRRRHEQDSAEADARQAAGVPDTHRLGGDHCSHRYGRAAYDRQPGPAHRAEPHASATGSRKKSSASRSTWSRRQHPDAADHHGQGNDQRRARDLHRHPDLRALGADEGARVLLGMDVLGPLDVLVIDYKTQELHVRFRGPQAPLGTVTRYQDRE